MLGCPVLAGKNGHSTLARGSTLLAISEGCEIRGLPRKSRTREIRELIPFNYWADKAAQASPALLIHHGEVQSRPRPEQRSPMHCCCGTVRGWLTPVAGRQSPAALSPDRDFTSLGLLRLVFLVKYSPGISHNLCTKVRRELDEICLMTGSWDALSTGMMELSLPGSGSSPTALRAGEED